MNLYTAPFHKVFYIVTTRGDIPKVYFSWPNTPKRIGVGYSLFSTDELTRNLEGRSAVNAAEFLGWHSIFGLLHNTHEKDVEKYILNTVAGGRMPNPKQVEKMKVQEALK